MRIIPEGGTSTYILHLSDVLSRRRNLLPVILVHVVELGSDIVERDLFVAEALPLQLLGKRVQVQLVQFVRLPASFENKFSNCCYTYKIQKMPPNENVQPVPEDATCS